MVINVNLLWNWMEWEVEWSRCSWNDYTPKDETITLQKMKQTMRQNRVKQRKRTFSWVYISSHEEDHIEYSLLSTPFLFLFRVWKMRLISLMRLINVISLISHIHIQIAIFQKFLVISSVVVFNRTKRFISMNECSVLQSSNFSLIAKF